MKVIFLNLDYLSLNKLLPIWHLPVNRFCILSLLSSELRVNFACNCFLLGGKNVQGAFPYIIIKCHSGYFLKVPKRLALFI